MRNTRGWPAKEAPFLVPISAAFAARSKAIRYKTKMFETERLLDESEGRRVQCLQISCSLFEPHPTCVRLMVRDGGEASLDVRQPSKNGWTFELSFDCHVSDLSGPEIVARFEETIAISDEMSRTPTTSARLRELWAGG